MAMNALVSVLALSPDGSSRYSLIAKVEIKNDRQEGLPPYSFHQEVAY
jgi:hypothetical protein